MNLTNAQLRKIGLKAWRGLKRHFNNWHNPLANIKESKRRHKR